MAEQHLLCLGSYFGHSQPQLANGELGSTGKKSLIKHHLLTSLISALICPHFVSLHKQIKLLHSTSDYAEQWSQGLNARLGHCYGSDEILPPMKFDAMLGCLKSTEFCFLQCLFWTATGLDGAGIRSSNIQLLRYLLPLNPCARSCFVLCSRWVSTVARAFRHLSVDSWPIIYEVKKAILSI